MTNTQFQMSHTHTHAHTREHSEKPGKHREKQTPHRNAPVLLYNYDRHDRTHVVRNHIIPKGSTTSTGNSVYSVKVKYTNENCCIIYNDCD